MQRRMFFLKTFELVRINGCGYVKRVKKFIKKIDSRLFGALSRTRRKLLRIYPINVFKEQSEKFIEEKNFYKARSVIKRGLKYYPNSYYLNKYMAITYTELGIEKESIPYWDLIIDKHCNKATEKDFIDAINAKMIQNDIRRELVILENGLRRYPRSIQLMEVAYDKYLKKKDYKSIINVLVVLFALDDYDPSVDMYISLSEAYLKENYSSRAEYICKVAIKEHPNNMKLIKHCIQIYIQLLKWDNALNLINNLKENFEEHLTFKEEMLYGMIYQLNGNKRLADSIYKDILRESLTDSEQTVYHEELLIFDNGETSIKFYKRNTKTDKVIITFDSLRMTNKRPSFAFKLLSEQNVDIIAVQKYKPKTYHQDLSLRDFLEAVEVLVKGYSKRISYGFSLGAYCAIYYTGVLDCTILALAPRLSVHPVYGRAVEKGKMPFHHNLQLKKCPDVRPIIVYDPKDKLDRPFVNNEVLKAYPNAHLVKIPYGGHSMAPHLLRMGMLKEFILKVINSNEIPTYDRRKKVKSANYHRLLGRRCLQRNKIRWAGTLADRAYELLPDDPLVVKLKIDVLKKEKNYFKAEKYLQKAIANKPKKIDYRLSLIDIFILQGNLLKADLELKKTRDLFGKKHSILSKYKFVEKAYNEVIKSE